jgi:uncharacterized protein
MLKPRIQEEMKVAMKAGEKRRLGIIRLILAALKQKEVDERIELEDSHVLGVLEKMIKQRRDSVSQYEQAGRTDLAEQEAYEIQVIQEYLPAALSEAEITALVDEVITATGAATVKDMGKVMGQLKPRLQGRADMGAVGALIKQRLGG